MRAAESTVGVMDLSTTDTVISDKAGKGGPGMQALVNVSTTPPSRTRDTMQSLPQQYTGSIPSQRKKKGMDVVLRQVVFWPGEAMGQGKISMGMSVTLTVSAFDWLRALCPMQRVAGSDVWPDTCVSSNRCKNVL